jgi:hypothetical protein
MVRDVQITGVCNVPTNVVVTAAALNFTIVTPTAAGHLTVFPKNGVVPLASLVNYVAGETIANAVDIGLGTGGQISVQPLTTTHLVIDVYGFFIDVEELAGQNTALGAGALSSNTTGSNNTALGFSALLSNTEGANNTATGAAALGSNTTGGLNTATGLGALASNITGSNNTATGGLALQSNTTGGFNTAVGANALVNNTTGGLNTATGVQALQMNTTGESNTATGVLALVNNITGNRNIALGATAGANVTTGNDNIHIGNVGVDTDTGLIRIGTAGTQTATFSAGIRDVVITGDPVVVIAVGQLGEPSSSRRVKDDVRDMERASAALLKLRPVSFRYKAPQSDREQRLQYGLIAEEVAEIYPELVTTNAQGEPTGVRYHLLPAMLLNELQRQQREIDELRAQVRALIDGRAAVRE